MADLRPVNQIQREAGAAYDRRPCTACHRKITREAPLIVEEHHGLYNEPVRPYHRQCHPTLVDKTLPRWWPSSTVTRGGCPTKRRRCLQVTATVQLGR
jgi:hypothetical protein